MSCSKPTPISCLLINTALVLIVCLAVDYVVYMLLFPSSNPYSVMIGSKIIYTVLLAFGYAHVYNKASFMWKPGSAEAFIYYPFVAGKECKPTGHKILNGVIFSALASLVVLMCITLSAVFISYVYIYVLHGFHGVPSPRDVSDVGGKLILAGMILEIGGKTGSDGHM